MAATIGGSAPSAQQKQDLAQAFELARVATDGSGNITGLVGPDGEEIVLGGGVQLRSGVQSFNPLLAAGVSYTTANRTRQDNIVCRAAGFYGVRLAFANFNTTTPTTISAKVASAPTLLNTGNTLTFQQVTFNGAATGVIPAAATNPDISAEVVPSVLFSDFIPVRSVARTDSGKTNPVLVVRTFDNNTIGIPYGTIALDDASSVAIGLEFASASSAAGDLVTTTTTAMAPSTGGSKFATAVQVDFYTTENSPTAKIAVFGASQSARIDFVNYAMQSMTASGKKNASIVNYAMGGYSLRHQSLSLRETVSKTKPDIVLFWSLTVNGRPSPYSDDDAWKILVSDIEYCKSVGIRPVVILRHAVNNANDPVLYGYYETAKAACQAGLADYLDWMDAVKDPANPMQVLPGYRQDATTHINAAGIQAFWTQEGQKLAALI